METDWDNLTPAPYYDLFMGFYLVESVHGDFTDGDNSVQYFAADDDDAFQYFAAVDEENDFENPDGDADFWDDVIPPPHVNDFIRMRG